MKPFDDIHLTLDEDDLSDVGRADIKEALARQAKPRRAWPKLSLPSLGSLWPSRRYGYSPRTVNPAAVIGAFLVWGAVGMTVTYWALLLANAPQGPSKSYPMVDFSKPAGSGDWSRMLGSSPAAPPAAAQAAALPDIKVNGIAAGGAGGLAIVTVAGNPRPIIARVGAEIGLGCKILAIQTDKATASCPGFPSFELSPPKIGDPPPAPQGGNEAQGAPGAMPMPMPMPMPNGPLPRRMPPGYIRGPNGEYRQP